MTTYMEIEVELVRTQKITFAIEEDPTKFMGISGLGGQAGSLLRTMQYWTHRCKDLVKGEHPRLVKWHVLNEHVMGKCEKYWNEEGHYIEEEVPYENEDNPCRCAERLLQQAVESQAAAQAN